MKNPKQPSPKTLKIVSLSANPEQQEQEQLNWEMAANWMNELLDKYEGQDDYLKKADAELCRILDAAKKQKEHSRGN